MATTAFPSGKRNAFIVRPATLFDIPAIAAVTRSAYHGNAVDLFLCPRGEDYPSHVERRCRQRCHIRHCDAAQFNVVACPASDPGYVVGFAYFRRSGDDSGAKAWKGRFSMWERVYFFLLGWALWLVDEFSNRVWPDQSSDVEHTRQFSSWRDMDEEVHWSVKNHPERKNRWRAQSVAVHPQWQGKGVGRLMMNEVLKKAQAEGVICALGASPEGERLYKKLGFERLGDFSTRIPGETEEQRKGGGIFMWTPEGEKL